jgi:dethiobiotin synthetase
MPHPAALRGCFVTGTDTEVGKTHISAAIVHALAASGWRSAGFKPVAAGATLIDGVAVNDDVRALRRASPLALTDAQVGPCQFSTACAPHIAAAQEGRAIDRNALLHAAHQLAAQAEVLVVEGVGGWLVPLGADWDSADLATDLGLPVVLVVGLRLGCINHARLSAQAVCASGLRLAGWVANSVSPAAMPWQGDNLASLRAWLLRQHDAPCLGVVPWLADPSPSAIATHLDLRPLHRLIGHPAPSATPMVTALPR